MELAIYNIKGEDTGRKAILNDEVFAIDANEHAIWLDVKQYLANQRQGTHKSKERSEVSGSTRKLHKQKGGGGARIGDINSPLLVGGGRVFGPRPRDYRFKLNKKLKQLARKSALTLKAADGEIKVVEDFTFDAPRTKDFVALAKNLQIDGKKVLLLLADRDKNVYLSARNIPNTRLMTASDINTYAVLDNKVLLLTEKSLEVINKLYPSPFKVKRNGNLNNTHRDGSRDQPDREAQPLHLPRFARCQQVPDQGPGREALRREGHKREHPGRPRQEQEPLHQERPAPRQDRLVEEGLRLHSRRPDHRLLQQPLKQASGPGTPRGRRATARPRPTSAAQRRGRLRESRSSAAAEATYFPWDARKPRRPGTQSIHKLQKWQ